MINILDCDSKTLEHVMNAIRLISKHYVEDLGYDGVNILNANNSAAEQSVFHLHFHIIPRKKNDGLHAWPSFPGAKHSLDEMAATLKLVK